MKDAPANWDMARIVRELAPLRRDLISDGYDAAANLLGRILPFEIERFPTGSECWTWTIPEKWTCRTARLERLNGEVVFSDADHPLHVVSYSLPYEGIVSRDELMKHLHTHPYLEDAVPFVFKYYQRDWGLCCSGQQKRTLSDAEYRVVIDTVFTPGELKVLSFEIPGASSETVVLCAHLCHPCQANDDISGVAAGVELMRRLLAKGPLRYTYVLLILPETIGSSAWLSRHEQRIPSLKSGIFLEMLGLENPHAVQWSFGGKSQMDRIANLAMQAEKLEAWGGPLLRVIGNDERNFNAPGVRVPMISVSRVLPASHPHYPFPEYHSDRDDVALCSAERLAASADFVEGMLDMLERDLRPKLKCRGEPFLSRYNLYRDWFKDRRANDILFESMFRFDGTASISEIAAECDLEFGDVFEVADSFHQAGLVEWAEG